MKDTNNIWNPEQKGSKKPPFDVPTGYFETFEDRLDARITALEEKPGTRKTIIRILKPVIGLAACFVLILLLVKYPLSRFTGTIVAETEIESTYERDLLEDVILSNTLFIDDKILVQTIATTDLSNNTNHEEMVIIASEELNDYEIFAELYN
ncbi:hypothetical protein [Mangrovibacterium sp.]|uniref:hypothetical protein n=1 Tax=Mangrovibacterium sp. TaxID=1961364 RepID=UPI00356315C1